MGIESNGYVLFETRDTAFGSSHTHVGIVATENHASAIVLTNRRRSTPRIYREAV